jgi:hypothetical protein
LACPPAPVQDLSRFPPVMSRSPKLSLPA